MGAHQGFQHPHLAPGERLHVQHAGDRRQLGHLVGHRGLGLDDVVDACEAGGQGLEVLDVVRVADSRDGLRDAAPLGSHTGDHVDLVGVGDRDEEIGPVHVHLLQYPATRAVAPDGQNIKLLRHPLVWFQVPVDDGHVVTFLAKDGRDIEAHLTSTSSVAAYMVSA